MIDVANFHAYFVVSFSIVAACDSAIVREGETMRRTQRVHSRLLLASYSRSND